MQLYSIAEMLENMEMLQHHEGTGTLDVYRLELPPPTQDASHHQDFFPFLGAGIPT